MSFQLENEKIVRKTVAKELCSCPHCLGINDQQEESELRWVKLHQMFDR